MLYNTTNTSPLDESGVGGRCMYTRALVYFDI